MQFSSAEVSRREPPKAWGRQLGCEGVAPDRIRATLTLSRKHTIGEIVRQQEHTVHRHDDYIEKHLQSQGEAQVPMKPLND